MTNVEKLNLRRGPDDPILDFMGLPYEFKPEPEKLMVDESNKREILNMSYNNRWFFFYNRITEKFCVYEL